MEIKTKSIIVILLFMICLICSSAFADLTQLDLEKIQQMLDKQKAELREYIDLKVDPIKDAISTLYWIVGLIGLFIVAVLAAPQWVTIKRETGDRKLAEKLAERIDRLEKELAEQRKAEGGIKDR